MNIHNYNETFMSKWNLTIRSDEFVGDGKLIVDSPDWLDGGQDTMSRSGRQNSLSSIQYQGYRQKKNQQTKNKSKPFTIIQLKIYLNKK